MSADSTPEDSTAETETVETEAETDDTVVLSKPKQAESKVAAKRAAREAQIEAEAASGREFTVSSRTLVRVLVALVAIVAVVAIGLLSWQVVAKSRTLGAFDEAKSASSSFLTTYFETMMATDSSPERIKDKITPLTTGEARDRVEADAKANAQWRKDAKISNFSVDVNATMVEKFTDSSATTIVAVTITATSAAAPAGGQQVVLLQLDLTKQDGTWLVSKMIPLPGVSSQEGSGPVGTNPGTTVPPTEGAPAPAPAPQPGG